MIGVLATAWALAAIGFTSTVLLRLARRPGDHHGSRPKILLVRAAEFLTARERSNLGRPLPAGVRCLVLGEQDLGTLPPHSVQLRLTPHGHNRKLALVQAALRQHGPVSGEQVIICDADVIVDAALLYGLAKAIEDGVDLAMAAPLPELGDGTESLLRRFTMASSRGLLAHSAHSFAALATVDPHAFCGKAIALSPRAVEQLLLLEDCIGEDLRLAEAVLGTAGRSACIGSPAHTLPSAGLARFARWQLVLKAHRPWAFIAGPWFLAPTLPLLGLTLLVRGPLLPLFCALVTVLVASRAVLARRLSRRHAWTFILGEALYLAAFATALVIRQVDWRGRTLRPSLGGSLVKVES